MPSFNWSRIPSLIRIWQRKLNKKKWFSLQSLILLKGLILSLLSAGVFVYISDNVIDKQTIHWDKNIMLAVRETHSPLLDFVMKTFSVIGGTITVTLLCLSLGVKFWMQRQKIELFGLTLAALGGTALNLLVKQFFNRERPEMWALTNDDLNTSSYPSGHVMIGLIVYGFCGYLLARHYQRWRGLILSGTVLLLAIIGWSRVYVGLHWPTDVLAGYAAGFAWLGASIFSFEIQKNRQKMRRENGK